MSVSMLFRHIGFGWLSLSLLGIVVGMFIAFADRPFGGAVIISSIGSFIAALVTIGYVDELITLFCGRDGRSK